MKKIEIDMDELIAVAVKHMEDVHDVRWSIGLALQELYWDKVDGWAEVQAHLIHLYRNQAEDFEKDEESYVFDASQEHMGFVAPRSLEIANAMNKIILEKKVKGESK